MICLIMNGRLGNHLFQYAFVRSVAQRTGDNIMIDWSQVKKKHHQEGDGWENSFEHFRVNSMTEGNVEEVASPLQMKVMKLNEKVTYHRFLKVLLPFVKFISQFFGVYVCLDAKYFPYIYYGSKNKIVRGYFECDKYFRNTELLLKTEIVPKYAVCEENKDFLRRIEESNSVCVTIRRGDFFTKENLHNLGMCCDEQYFKRGIDYIKGKYPDAVVFFFSDDIAWVREHIAVDREVYYESGVDPLWEKLRLMSACKHFVISNSTFSWWSQYLSKNKNKIVIAPKRWRADDNKYDIKQDGWILL